MTLVDTLPLHVPTISRRRVLDLAFIGLGSIAVAVAARIEIPLPWTPVPITGQTLGVLLVGAALGWRRGAAALGLYLAEGAAGLPVFAGGGAGVAHLLGPTGGYLWSFPFAAGLVGWLAERGWDRSIPKMIAATLLGGAILYIPGLLWLQTFVGGMAKAVEYGLTPFWLWDITKALVVAFAVPATWRLIGK
jgi:biotin transport system substrate-specific component